MKRKGIILTLIIISLSITVIAQSNNFAQAVPEYDTIIFYMVPDKQDNIQVGDEINVTIVFKNFLANNNSLYNVTTELNAKSGLNITNTYNIAFEDPNYNKTDLFVYGTNSTPIFYWNHTYIEIAWAQFDQNETQMLWFILEIVDTEDTQIEQNTVNFELEGEEDHVLGSGLGLIVEEPSNTSAIPNPMRGEWEWYWWFIGSLVLAAPLIAIVITRLTQWKR